MAPTSGRKNVQHERPSTPLADPLCKHHPDVAPHALGAFDHSGNRITTPSGAFVSVPTVADSAASRSCRSLADGALLLSPQPLSAAAAAAASTTGVAAVPLWPGSVLTSKSAAAGIASAVGVASQTLAHRARTTPADPPAHKKCSDALSSYLTPDPATALHEVARFLAAARALNSTSLKERDALEVDKSALQLLPGAIAEIERGVTAKLPNVMRLHTFKNATSSADFPRFSCIVPASNKSTTINPLMRAAELVSSILSLKHFCDNNNNNSNASDVDSSSNSDRFGFHNRVLDNVSGIASTLCTGILPRSMVPAPAAAAAAASAGSKPQEGFYSFNFVDAAPQVLFHADGYYWRIPVAAGRSEQSALHILHQFNAAKADLAVPADGAADSSASAEKQQMLPRKNDVDLADLTRCSAQQCAAAIATVGGVCRANAECMADAFRCSISVSMLGNSSNNSKATLPIKSILDHDHSGQSAFAPVSVGVYPDGSAVLSWSTAFVNDECAAAMTQWLVKDSSNGVDRDAMSAQQLEGTYLANVQQKRLIGGDGIKSSAEQPPKSQDQGVLDASLTASLASRGNARRAPSAPRSRNESKMGTPAPGDVSSSAAALVASVAEKQVSAAAAAAAAAPAPALQGGRVIEVVRTKPQEEPAAAVTTAAQLEATVNGTPRKPVTPLSGAARGVSRGLPPSGAAGGASAASPSSSPFATGAAAGPLERVTITVLNALAPAPVPLTIWMPRTVQLPNIDRLAQQEQLVEFSCRLRDPAHSVHFAAALALWPASGGCPPDVLCWNRSKTGVEPLLYLCRSDAIDRFLHAVVARGGGSSNNCKSSGSALGPLPHDLAVLRNKAKQSLQQMMARGATPHLSVLAAILALGGIVNEQQSNVSRFAHPAIVISTTSTGAASYSPSRFGPLLPPLSLFQSSTSASTSSSASNRPLELQLTWNRQVAAANTNNGCYDVGCILRAGAGYADLDRIRFLISRFAALVDEFEA